MNEQQRNPYLAAGRSAAIQAGIIITGITLGAHREGTHESVEIDPRLRFAGDLVLWLSSTVQEIWSDVHGPHHKLRDANLVPIIKVGDALRWCETHPHADQPPLPSIFTNLDPAAALRPEDVKLVSAAAREMKVRNGTTIKELYQPPEEYTRAELQALFDNVTPRYFYETKPGRLSRLLTIHKPPVAEPLPVSDIDSIAHQLRDAHSPSLDLDGILGILLHGVGRYRTSAKVFAKERDEANDYDMSSRSKRFFVKYKKWGPVALFAGNIGYRLAKTVAKGEFSAETAKAATLEGSLAAGGALVALLFGGNLTNSGGHAGDVHPVHRLLARDLPGLWQELTVPPPVKADGTYTTDAAGLGILTEDEVSRQRQHHLYPEKIAYTTESGWRKVKQAPYGSFIEFLVRHGLGLHPGRQFGERDNPEGFDRSKRPDMPAEAVLMLEAFRVRTLAEKQHELERVAA